MELYQVKNVSFTYPGRTAVSYTHLDAVLQHTVEYKFTCREKSPLDVPDRVVDYLNIGSQYTNKQYGKAPELSLAGEVISLGNFGGYITYYYEDALTDDPHNKYGIDFYVIGNVFGEGGESLSEPGQVYVSEDGEKWYALAGSEYYLSLIHIFGIHIRTAVITGVDNVIYSSLTYSVGNFIRTVAYTLSFTVFYAGFL